jgi:hypothetical protein
MSEVRNVLKQIHLSKRHTWKRVASIFLIS